MLQMSIEAALARRDWLVFMVGVAAVCVITGRGTAGEWGMEAFGFRRPLGVSIMAWILSSVENKNKEKYFPSKNSGEYFVLFVYVCTSCPLISLLCCTFFYFAHEKRPCFLMWIYNNLATRNSNLLLRDFILFLFYRIFDISGAKTTPSIWCMKVR